MLIHTEYTHESKMCNGCVVCFEFDLHRILIVNSVSQFAGLNLLSAIYSEPNLHKRNVKGDQPRSVQCHTLSPSAYSRVFWQQSELFASQQISCDLFVNVCALMFIDWVTVSDCKIIGFILLIRANKHSRKKHNSLHLHRIRTQIRIWIYIHNGKKGSKAKSETFQSNWNAHIPNENESFSWWKMYTAFTECISHKLKYESSINKSEIKLQTHRDSSGQFKCLALCGGSGGDGGCDVPGVATILQISI